MHIIQLSSREARDLLTELRLTNARGNYGLRSLRVAVQGDSVMFKVNEQMWSPPLGKLDPECEEAQKRRAKEIDAMNEANRQEWEEMNR